MGKIYTVLGLMSGTSMDGIDASIIKSDGETQYDAVFNKYFQYNEDLYQDLINLRNKIINSQDLKIYQNDINVLEREITLFHAEVVNDILNESKISVDYIGFHGQTIFHNASEKISKQLGDANLLSQLTKKEIVYNFRENDLKNGGQGAPLTPIFHRLVTKKSEINLPACIINIGGITNITIITSFDINSLKSYDIGPGNCLIDEWIRIKTKKKYDENGEIARLGSTSEIILNQIIDNFDSKKILSFDIKDFNLNFIRGLSLEDGASTLTDFTAKIISNVLLNISSDLYQKKINVLICGGGRKNITLIKSIKKNTFDKFSIQIIDDYGLNGDFIESQAFAYLAIRSYLKLDISFPKTTSCNSACTGGVLIKNF